MKKVSILLVAAVTFLVLGSQAHADPATVVSFNPSVTSARADNSSTIIFTVHSQKAKCANQYPSPPAPVAYDVYPEFNTNECDSYVDDSYSSNVYNLSPYVLVANSGVEYQVSVSGSGNTLSASDFYTDSSGNASFTLKSSTPEQKTVELLGVSKTTYLAASVDVTFTAAPSNSTSSPHPAASHTTTSSSPQPSSNEDSLIMPSLASVSVAGETKNIKSTLEFASDQPLVLSGKTVPFGIVTLIIHSTPRTVNTTADSSGNWSYKVTNLAPGSHTIQESIKDPATGKTSSPQQLLTFTVKAPTAAAAPVTKKTTNFSSIGLGVAALVLVSAGFYYWDKKHENS